MFDYRSLEEIKFLGYHFFGNSVLDYVVAMVILVVIYFAFILLKRVVISRLVKLSSKTKNNFDNLVVNFLREVSKFVYFVIALYFAVYALEFDPIVYSVMDVLLSLAAIYLVVDFMKALIDYIGDKRGEKTSQTALFALKIIVNIGIWALGFLFILSNLGIDVTSLIAGLGIGGIAVALAVQNILQDLLSSFAIYFDKPFEIGDFIIVGDQRGNVEKIGLKTTRLRSLDGEEIIISNNELISERILNYKTVHKRRGLFTVGVAYDTDVEKLRAIPGMIEEIITSYEDAEFDRAHLRYFNESDLGFEVVFFVRTQDFAKFLEVNQLVFFEILERFKKEAIEIPFPTRTIVSKS